MRAEPPIVTAIGATTELPHYFVEVEGTNYPPYPYVLISDPQADYRLRWPGIESSGYQARCAVSRWTRTHQRTPMASAHISRWMPTG